MVVPAGDSRLCAHSLLLLVLLLLAKPVIVAMAVAPLTPTAVVSAAQPAHHSPPLIAQRNGPQALADPQHAALMAADSVSGDDGGISLAEDIQVGCRELRAKRYISDGFCTSTEPIKEVVCTGHCLPIRNLPWYAEFVKVWAPAKLRQWQCLEDVVRRKSVHLLCRNGDYRTYRIKVVRSCKCEQVTNKDNMTSRPGDKKRKKKRKGRKGRKKKRKNRRGRKKSKRPPTPLEEVEGRRGGVDRVEGSQAGQRQTAERHTRKDGRKTREHIKRDPDLVPPSDSTLRKGPADVSERQQGDRGL